MQSWQASLFGFSNQFIGIVGFTIVITIAMAIFGGARFRTGGMQPQLGLDLPWSSACGYGPKPYVINTLCIYSHHRVGRDHPGCGTHLCAKCLAGLDQSHTADEDDHHNGHLADDHCALYGDRWINPAAFWRSNVLDRVIGRSTIQCHAPTGAHPPVCGGPTGRIHHYAAPSQY